ncbi:mitotic spindle checkpoint protein MAD1-like isoform X2 [Cornus florida]|uniref:mitotic spindle checkpoint protein MAD1-like isoform X2 n=1 Tax=Cornus florida TaxID=4283 RepID=UPI00289CE611|nr:mitotic spindle checkpoint protein MAD1-like isoform X2 [Cornus florida]XP_059648269.1 mitotic spindle checkpoint protein MAD1-like isoform X2 [Cornus florida]XP_059648270.1 mitotic spindle checkpoint protein MAD1-like isoform X2 [Cornus florida]XP_059648271.1 mitotic spindle checkpoint protein MAD1-like isoform X2 [Cornus florida]XP_059648272.1 mitotic spindle checkpoint protein MAD1-like isoform X2 [Cornus florida]
MPPQSSGRWLIARKRSEANAHANELTRDLKAAEVREKSAETKAASAKANAELREKEREKARMELSKSSEIQKNLVAELSAWKLVTKDIPDIFCPDDIPMKFTALNREVADCKDEIRKANACADQLKMDLKAVEFSKNSDETKAASTQANAKLCKGQCGYCCYMYLWKLFIFFYF